MAILGIGVDAIEVSRIAQLLERYGNRFVSKVFQPEEADYCWERADPAQHFAARFAAREAVAKALGTGFTGGVTWRSIWVERNDGVAPRVHLRDGAAQRAMQMGVKHIWLSLTHTKDLAIAVAVLEG